MKAKRWIVRGHNADQAASLARVLGVSPILAALLINRGYADERSARTFLTPVYDQLHEPYLMLGMKEAVARLQHAIDNDEPILIYGDYDVDGTTGTAILPRVSAEMPASVVSPRFPPTRSEPTSASESSPLKS